MATNSGVIKGRLVTNKEIQVSRFGVNVQEINLRQLADVDASTVTDGSVLIYNGVRNVFETKTDIENPNTKIIGGSF